MSQKNHWFNFKNWSFKWEKVKEETGRVVCFKESEIRHSFTLECTFYGRIYSNSSEQLDQHMNDNEYICVGEDLERILISFLPFPKYRRKLNFLSKKFIKIIHEEALKFWIPFNNERYFKKMWLSQYSFLYQRWIYQVLKSLKESQSNKRLTIYHFNQMVIQVI